jgi:hypothetical protein
MAMLQLTRHSVKQFLTQKLITEIEHPLCSFGLAPNNFWVFTKIKSVLKGRRFQDIEDIHKNMTALKPVRQQKFQKHFQQLQQVASLG